MAVAVEETPRSFREEIEPAPRRIALLFPGQGLEPETLCSYYAKQVSGDVLHILRDNLSLAEELTKRPLRKYLEEGDFTSLSETSIAQPVIYTLSRSGLRQFFGYFQAERRRRIRFDELIVAGHSLGEYTALTAAHVVDFEDGLRIVTERGRLMQEASKQNETGLTSILGLSEDDVRKICDETNTSVALINAPQALVVGGELQSLGDVDVLAQERGAKRTIRLSAQGAFHTEYMRDAAMRLGEFLKSFEFERPRFPLVINLDGVIVSDARYLRRTLISSMTQPVQWVRVIENMRKMGVEMFIELGPGNSLASLNRLNGIPSEQTRNF